MHALTVARVIWMTLVVGLALLAVFRAPIGALWMPAVAATEFGYLMVLLTIPAFVHGYSSPDDAAFCVAGVFAIALFTSSLVRVHAAARALPHGLDVAFGRGPHQEGATPEPFAVSRLLRLTSPDVNVETHVYAPEEAHTDARRLDFYGGASPGASRPLVVVIHGGSWSGGDRTQLPAMARRLADDGYAVATIDYRLAPRHRFPAALDDVRLAVDWLRARGATLGIDPDRVVLYGRSAGGHLALLAAYRWKERFVRGVIALYAPSDLEWSWAHPSNPLVLDTPTTLGNFLGGGPDDSPELRRRYRDASPIQWADASSPPTLLVHGGRDELVNPRQTERLEARLARLGVPRYALRLPWATHGCEANLAGPSGQLVTFAVLSFLAREVAR